MSTGVIRTIHGTCGFTRSVNDSNVLRAQLCSLLTERLLTLTLGCVMYTAVTRHYGMVRALVAVSELLVVVTGRVCGWRSWYCGAGLLTEHWVFATLCMLV
jgi:hypothetical protein